MSGLLKFSPLWGEISANEITSKEILEKLTEQSHRRVLWLCKFGHEWDAPVYERSSGAGCAYCSNRRVLEGYNDLLFLRPDLARQWSSKNVFPADSVTPGSTKRVWWECAVGHEWDAVVRDRKSDSCPVCLNQRIIVGVNDLATTHKKLSDEWNFKKNGELVPSMIVAGSGKKVWWECAEGHEWEAVCYERSNGGTGCPYCSRRLPVQGINDFFTTHKELMLEWHITKNNGLNPLEMLPGSDTKVWWQCSEGHEWETFIYNRTGKNLKGCPYCHKPRSRAEIEIAEYLKEIVSSPVVLNSKTILNSGKELDIYIPDNKIAVEYNGLYWHSENYRPKNYHYDKWLACKEQGIQLIQIWEDDWVQRPALIKSILNQRLRDDKNQNERRFEELLPVKLSANYVTDFLNKNHIQGAIEGSIEVGLATLTGELAAVAVFDEDGGENRGLVLLRFVSVVCPSEDLKTLLGYVEGEYLPSKIIAFSDNCLPNDNLYVGNGFAEIQIVEPEYMYAIKGERVKRSRTLLPEQGLVPKIWDAGKTIWVKNLK